MDDSTFLNEYGPYMQWAATFFSILYVILAARESIWCWPIGILGTLLFFIVVVNVGLFSDGLLQVFYIVMSIYGWVSWARKPGVTLARQVQSSVQARAPQDDLLDTDIKTEPTGLQISYLSVGNHFNAILAGVFFTIILGFFWRFFGAALPFIDAFTTAFSIIATIMVTRKIIDNWIYWIVIDLISVGVYWYRGLPVFALLFVVYTIIAVYGWYSWRGRMIAISGDATRTS